LGAIQGITEWLPISSQGIILLLNSFFDADNNSLENLFAFSLSLHLGTSLSALVIYRNKITSLIKESLGNNKSNSEILFYIFSTFISLIVSLPIYLLIPYMSSNIELVGVIGMIVIGFIYLLSAFIQYIGSQSKNLTRENKFNFFNAFFVGIFQAFSIIPGISRSGMTISALLIRKFDKNDALNISFILSIPVTFIGGILGIYVLGDNILTNLFPVFIAFVFGCLTIKLLIQFTKTITFYKFILSIGLALILGGVIYIVYI
tara:strand:+ start:421 stop:1203 length:783 start_codon:yes stop_codon:yes gene_type:complete